MTRVFALIHSPLVGPATWSAVADDLRGRGERVLVPDLDGDETAAEPLWQQHVRAAARAIGDQPGLIVVAHSGAGALLPAIRAELGRPLAGYVFVDAGLPSNGPRRGTGAFARHLAELLGSGRRFPEWTEESLRALVPDDELRRALVGDLRPQPPRFWDEVIPVFTGWPDAQCGYLRFAPNPSYDDAARDARRRGWPYRELAGTHFHMLADPKAVADALVSLAEEMRHT